MLTLVLYIIAAAALLCQLRQTCKLRTRVSELEKSANHDSLTGLLNRRGGEIAFEHERAVAHRDEKPFAILYLDLDNFKPINDRYGHEAGDQALIYFSRLLKSCLRASDIVARMGGDEFCVGLHQCDIVGAEAIREEIKTKLEKEPFRFDGKNLRLGVSIGTASLHDSSGKEFTVAEMIKRADTGMYEEKITD